MHNLKLALIVGIAALISEGRLQAEAQEPTSHVPSNCSELDHQLQVRDGLGPFLAYGVKETKATTAKLPSVDACKVIEKTSGYVGALIGIASYCDTESVLHEGARASPLYKRLGTVLRTVGNDLHTLASERGCWK